jgi:hypothetical protein
MVVKLFLQDTLIRTTKSKRGSSDAKMLNDILDRSVPKQDITMSGQTRGRLNLLNWRVSPSTEAGLSNMVLAKKCEQKSQFDDWVSISTRYPGDPRDAIQSNKVLLSLSHAVQCKN